MSSTSLKLGRSRKLLSICGDECENDDFRSGLKREEVFLTTKIMSQEHGINATRDALNDSLRKSGLDHWSLCLLHDPNSGKTKRIEAFAALAEAQKQGLVKDIGVSNFGVRHMQELKAAGLPTPGQQEPGRQMVTG